ncbi:MAG: hypothetical protein IJ537_11170 [Bacteroidaceae bacterium]|nr:hypothetical protein [Bacteroidaceae bacterium]
MRKYISAIMMLAMVLQDMQAQNTNNDEKPGGWDFELPSIQVGKAKKNDIGYTKLSLGGFFAFGFITGIGEAKDVNIDMGQSFELELGDVLNYETRIGKRDFLQIGLGFDWRNYRVTDFKRFAKDEQGVISMQDYPEGTEPKFSRIHTFSLSLPVKYYHYLSKKVLFGIGPELYFTPYGSLKTRYYEEGEKRKLTAGNVHQNRFSVGVGAEIIIHHFGVYYKYNPFGVLRSAYGPKFSSMTVGLKVGF